jgi:hypothetical protein
MTTFGDRVFQSGGIPVGGDLLGLIGDGQVFYLDPTSGDDANNGSNPTTNAVATLSRAVALATSGRGDVIVRLPGTETVTAKTTVNKDHLLVVAATSAFSPPAGWGAGGEEYLMWGSAITDAPVVEYDAPAGASFMGLGFANASTGATEDGAAINIENLGDGEPGFGYIAYCEFPSWGTNNSGVYLHGADHVLLYRNYFGGASGTLPNGVALGGSPSNNPVNNVIKENIFCNCTIGIRIFDGTPADLLVQQNVFMDIGTASIDFDGGGAGQSGQIVGNWFDGSTSTAVDSITGGTDTVTGVIADTGFEFCGNNYLET